MIKLIISALIGYFLGSVSIAVVLTKLCFRQDVRSEGSGNAGATNVARVFGMKAGVLTLIGDILKTLAAGLIGKALGGEGAMCAALAACLLGHCFPVFFGFKGGKGVSVGVAIGLCVDWRVLLIAAAVFFIVFALSRRVSLCSLSAGVVLPVAYFALCGADSPEFSLLVYLLVVVAIMHRANIKRLINGTEPKFTPKSK